VYDGADTVAETLRSLSTQTYRDFRVLISVDAGDEDSAAVCKPFAEDPRFSIAVHDERLGWHGNFNWLVRRADLPFYCFWQQDDLAEPDFLERLRAEMMRHPDTAIAYADIQWFGARSDRQSAPSIVGSAPSRVREHILRLSHVPLLGMMRAGFFDRSRHALAETPDESSQQEFVFLARLAAAGAFRRVGDTLYHKRAGPASTHLRFLDLSEARRRREWIAMGVGLIDVASRVYRPSRLATVAEFVAERLAVRLPGRDYFYLPAPTDLEIARFVAELLAEARLEPGVLASRRRRNALLGREAHPAVRTGIERAVEASRLCRSLTASLADEGRASIAFGTGAPGLALLAQGWSVAEAGGVWAYAYGATLLLPELPAGRWAVTVAGLPRTSPAAARNQRIEWALGSEERRVAPLDAATGAAFTFEFDLGVPDETPVLHLTFPDASAPASAGTQDDPRRLGFFVSSVTIRAL
jgi:glycosyltransferase involved in cell wall biosynthesis